MAKRRPKPAELFTEDEIKRIQHAALDVWNEIGYDVLTEGMGEDAYLRAHRGKQPIMRRSVVVELVLDADRLFERLRGRRRGGVATPDDGFAAKLTYNEPYITAIEAVVKDAFPYQWYGL